jgi:hypothetical protein
MSIPVPDKNTKVEKIIDDMMKDPDFNLLMTRLAGMEEDDAWNNEGGLVTEDHIKNNEERLKYMEDNGI